MNQPTSKLEKYSAIAGIISGVLAVIGFTYPYITNSKNIESAETIKISQNNNLLTNSPQEQKLSKVFSSKMIGGTTNFVESIIGPAINVDAHFKTRDYEVDGCKLIIGATADGTITSMTINLSPVCNFNWRLAFPNHADLPQPNKLKFGDVMKIENGWKITADCLISCGNSYDPVINLSFGGSRADDWQIVVLGAVIAADVNIEANSAFAEKITKEKGEDFVRDEKYKCNYDLEKAAIGTLEPMKVNFITIKADSKEVTPKDCGI